MKLIINADDFGYSRGINFGILDAYQFGVVRSCSIMANMPAFDHAVQLAEDNPGLGIGVHLNLTCGKPLTDAGELTGPDGLFRKKDDLFSSIGEVPCEVIEAEWETQIEKVKGSGVNPDHLDSHHHVHMLRPVLPTFLKLAGKYNLPVRLFGREYLPGEYKDIVSPDRFSGDFHGKGAAVDTILKLVDENKTGCLEIMCHPGYLDETILKGSGYSMPRPHELHQLTSSDLITKLQEKEVQLVTFSQLDKE
ncbi:hypothetical protein BN3661_01866 [Eubacteriaceae bacterium CHKCI005]|nr:hypothetical protein BN3661_01866 [Eubacteriaceae bacterium CHKCI005]